MTGKEIVAKAISPKTPEMAEMADGLAQYIDDVLSRVPQIKAQGASALDARRAITKVINAHIRKVWGGSEIAYTIERDGSPATMVLTVSTINTISDLLKDEINGHYEV